MSLLRSWEAWKILLDAVTLFVLLCVFVGWVLSLVPKNKIDPRGDRYWLKECAVNRPFEDCEADLKKIKAWRQ